MKEADLTRALQCLSNRFKLVCDSNNEKDCSVVESMAVPSRSRLGELRGGWISTASSSSNIMQSTAAAAVNHRPIVHPFTCSDRIYHVCSVLPHSLPSITLPLLEAMFYRYAVGPRACRYFLPTGYTDCTMVFHYSRPFNQQPFFSISIIEEDISLVLDTQDLQRYYQLDYVDQLAAPTGFHQMWCMEVIPAGRSSVLAMDR